MNNLFERAKSVGLNHIREFLPDGRLDGTEWVCYSKERDEKTPSLKVNINTGKWSDFGDSAIAGNDTVSLYAYLNRSDLEHKAKNYKNFEGGIQTEAAKAILENHDDSYFPDPSDDFTAPVVKGDYWTGFRQDTRGIKEPPELDTGWYEKNWGQLVNKWEFFRKDRLIMYAARFQKEGEKKNDRPFTLWTNGTEYRWRAKGLPAGEIPLWGLPELLSRPNDPFILFEGQKDPSVAVTVIGSDYVCIGFYGGAGNLDKTDTSPLLGREGYFWTDADTTGRKVIKSLESLKLDLKLIRPPLKVKKGWGIADAIQEDGWNRDKIIQHIEGNTEPEDTFIDSGFPFRITGTTASYVYFYTKETTQLMKYKKSGLNKGALMTLMPKQDWGVSFTKQDGGTAWDSAIDWVLREAADAPIYNNSLVRGSGAWIDDGKVVIHKGDKILIGDVHEPLFEFKSKYTYEKKPIVPYSNKDPISTDDASKLYNIIAGLDWNRPEYGAFVAGWLFLAPFSGALEWRPHVWMSGTQGSGKSWILDKIVFPLLGAFNIPALGTSTVAGVRQAQNNCTLCVTIDEAESDTKTKTENVEGFLTMARQASSGVEGGSAILHGNQEGTGTEWRMQNMFMFASIGAVLKHGADQRRFNICLLRNPKRSKIEERKKRFDALEKKIEMITPTWSRAFYSRALNNIDETLKAVKIFKSQVSVILGTIAAGDQTGTLLAGAYMCTHDVAPLASECKVWLDQWNLSKDMNETAAEDECITELLSAKIEIMTRSGKDRFPIGSLIRYWFVEMGHMTKSIDDYDFSMDTPKIKMALETVGIKPVSRSDNYIQIAARHRELKVILKDTPWKDNYIDILKRLDYCDDDLVSGGKFAGVSRMSYIKLKADELLDDCPF